jgi:membrane-associated protein
MELISYFIDLFLHLDRHLNEVIQDYGVWTYLILFLIIFCETGLVVTPILPGDSLLFAAGALAAISGSPLNVLFLFFLLSVAAILGDTVNYWIGSYIGPRAFRSKSRFLKREYLDKTHEFYEKYGGKTIIIARFVPIVRTFAPFVAGVGSMTYWRFFLYNVVGGVLWVAICVFAGYIFGNIPFVKKNFSIVVLAIIFISILPGVIEYVRSRKRRSETKAVDGSLIVQAKEPATDRVPD